MYLESLKGILAPFLGTSLGAAFALFMKKNLGDTLQRMLNGFAAGVMAAGACVLSGTAVTIIYKQHR